MHKSRSERGSKAERAEAMQAVDPRKLNGHACNPESFGGLRTTLQIPGALTAKSRTSQTSPKIQPSQPTTPNLSRSSLSKLAGGNITMLDNRLTLEDRLHNKFNMSKRHDAKDPKYSNSGGSKAQRKPSFDDPYAFSEFDPEPSKKKTMQTTISSISNLGLNVKTSTCTVREVMDHGSPTSKISAAPRTTSIARLYPQLAEKLERSVSGGMTPAPVKPVKIETDKAKAMKAEQKNSKSSQRSSRTMNRLHAKIAQNKIKDKLKKTSSGGSSTSCSQRTSNGGSTSCSQSRNQVTNCTVAPPANGAPTMTDSVTPVPVNKAKTRSKPKASSRKQAQKDVFLRNALSTAPVPYVVHNYTSNLSASERLSQLGQSCTSTSSTVTHQRANTTYTQQGLQSTVTMASDHGSQSDASAMDARRLSNMLHPSPVLSTPPLTCLTSASSSVQVSATVGSSAGQQSVSVQKQGSQSSLSHTTIGSTAAAGPLALPVTSSKARAGSQTLPQYSGDVQQLAAGVASSTPMPHMPGHLHSLAGTHPLPQLPLDLKAMMGIHPPLLSPVVPQQMGLVSPQPALTPPKLWLPTAGNMTTVPLGSITPGSIPPGAIPPGSIPPGAIPPGAIPPGSIPPGSIPQGSMLPGSIPPGSMLHGSMPHVSMPPGTIPPVPYPGFAANINMNIPVPPPTWWPPVDGGMVVPVPGSGPVPHPKLQPLSVIPPGTMYTTPSTAAAAAAPPPPSLPSVSTATSVAPPSSTQCMYTVRPRRKRNLLCEAEIKAKIRRPSAMCLYSLHARRKVENSTFLPYGVDSSEEDDSDAEDLLPWQHEFRTTFSDSEDDEREGDDLDQEISSSIRRTKLELVRCKLRRRCTQLRKSQRGNSGVRRGQQGALEAMIAAVRQDERAAVTALLHVCHQVKEAVKPSCTLPGAGRRECLHTNEDDVQCGGRALPYANHCLKHIMYNVDQQMFDYCTAKFSNNTQCCVPVFDVRHELPLCPEHAAKADNYQKNLDSKPKKPRKRTKPSALTRPPKKGKKKKNQKRPSRTKKVKSPEPVMEDEEDAEEDEDEDDEEEETLDVADVEDFAAEDIADIDVTSSAGDMTSSSIPTNSQESGTSYGGGASSSQDSGVEVNVPSTSLHADDDLHNTHLQTNIDQDDNQSLDDDPLSPDTIDRSLDLPLDQEQAFFGEHDLHDVLNKLPAEAFNIFTGKNGEFIRDDEVRDDDEVLQQLVAEASQGVASEEDKIAQELISENSNDDELTKQIAYSILTQNLSPTGSIGDDINHDNLSALASSISASDLKQISQVLTPSVLNSALGGVDASGLGAGEQQPTVDSVQNTIGVTMPGFVHQPQQQQQQQHQTLQDFGVNALSSGAESLATNSLFNLDTVTRGLLAADPSMLVSKQQPTIAPQMLLPGNTSATPLGATVFHVGLPHVQLPDFGQKMAAPMAGYTTEPQSLGPGGATNLQLSWGGQPTCSVPTTCMTQPFTPTLGLANGLPTATFPAQNLSLSGLKFAYPVQALLPGTAVVAAAPDGGPLNISGQQFPAQTLLTIANSLPQQTQLANSGSIDYTTVGLENGS